MEMIFIIGTSVSLAAILLLHVYIFQWLANRNLLERFSFGKAFAFLFVWWLGTTIISTPINLLLDYSTSYLVNIVVGFGVFYLLINKFSTITLIKSLKLFVLFGAIATVISLVVVISVRGFLFSPFVVSGVAMNPTFETGDYLIIKRFGSDYTRGDVVVYEYEQGKYFVHRIVGLPSEEVRIEDGDVSINGNTLDEPYIQGTTNWEEGVVTLGSNEYFLLGDNREQSNDSRFTGAVSEERIFGEYLTTIGLLSTSGWVE